MSEYEERYSALQARFLARSAEDLVVIERAAAAPDSADRQALRGTVHRLSGAAGTFGFKALSTVAGEADDALVIEQADITAELDRLIVELKRTLAAAAPT